MLTAGDLRSDVMMGVDGQAEAQISPIDSIRPSIPSPLLHPALQCSLCSAGDAAESHLNPSLPCHM